MVDLPGGQQNQFLRVTEGLREHRSVKSEKHPFIDSASSVMCRGWGDKSRP